MRLHFCGVRGSTPVAGAPFARVGGRTSCIAVSAGARTRPTLLLDAGTGLQCVAEDLGGAPFDGAILLTHLHWDHMQGLPFFPAADRPDARTTVYMPAQGDPLPLLERAMSPPHFPITPSELRGAWSFRALDEGAHRIEGYDVLALDIPHKGGRTFGYRVDDGTTAIAYLPDHAPLALGPGPDGLGARHEHALALARDVDVLVHGGQFVEAEQKIASAYGHATVEYAAHLAVESGARSLVLTHHSPARVDDAVDELVRVAAKITGEIEVRAATDGMIVDTGT